MAVPDELINLRYQASIDPEVVANPPLRRPSGLRTLSRMDLTRDKRLTRLATPTFTFGSDFPFASVAAGKLFAAGLESCPNLEARTQQAIDRTNALALFPRLGDATPPAPQPLPERIRHDVSRRVMRFLSR